MSKTIYLTEEGAVLSILDYHLTVHLFGGIPFEETCNGLAEYEICTKEEKNTRYAYLQVLKDQKRAILFNDKPKYDEETDSYLSDGFMVPLELAIKPGFHENQLSRLMILRLKTGC